MTQRACTVTVEETGSREIMVSWQYKDRAGAFTTTRENLFSALRNLDAEIRTEYGAKCVFELK